MKKPFLEAGKAVGTHGLKGEIRFEAWCDSPSVLLDFKTFYLDRNGENAVSVEFSRVHKNLLLLKLSGVDSIESAEKFRGKILFSAREDFNISDDDYFIQDLLDSKVFDADSNEFLGELTDVSKTGANDVWHISKNGKEYLVPAVTHVIISVDTDIGKIVIRPMEGIFDED